jgi:photosystem II stability/assembly factor-like uncharacterized protein
MKKIIVLVIAFFVSFNICFSQGGWYQLSSGTTFTLRDVYFINEMTGWAVGDSSGRVLMTTTGGTSWTTQQIGSPGLYTINFANSSTGYIGGGSSIMGYTGVSYLYKTTNQGLNWFFLISDYGGDNIFYYSSIAIISPDIIYTSSCGTYSLGGSVGNVRKSTNGGVNFSTGYGVGEHKSVSFINEQTGWTVANYWDDIGKRYSYILKTTNSGSNWINQIKDSVRIINFSKIKFFDGNTGYALGGCNSPNRTLFFKTTNGGINWDSLVIPNSGKYNSMYFLNVSTGWICGYSSGDTSAISKTTNGGQTWQSQRKGYSNTLNGIFMVNPNTGYAVGNGGVILKTITGGTYYSISGTVRYSDNNQSVTTGSVKAFRLNVQTGQIIILDSTGIQTNGSYILNNVPTGDLYIGAVPNSSPPADYVPTYYPSAIYYRDATILNPTGNLTGIDIRAFRMSQATTSNSVNGKVNSSTPVSPLKDANVYAKSGSTFVGYKTTGSDGIYHINSVPTGTLKIIVDRIGYRSDSTTVTITRNNIDSVNFYLMKLFIGINPISNNIPDKYFLYQNYPNPFNPSTIIKFQIKEMSSPHAPGGDLTTLKIYDILGKEVAILVNENLKAGEYEVTFNGSRLPSGIYFYKLIAGDFAETKKMVLIK